MNIAVIPARGGSKRIPRKNIREFSGKPVIFYAIDAARRSGLFDRIVVSTDDKEIAEVARKFGAETPFMRPPELSDDQASTVSVIAHAIKVCQSLNWIIENACCIYPCVPLLQVKDIQATFSLLQSCKAEFSFPVTEFPSAIQRALHRLDDGSIQPFYPQFEMTRTQDLECAYYDVGQFYWGTSAAWLTHDKIHSNGVGYPIPNWRVVDIDTSDDWKRAEIFYSLLTSGEKGDGCL